ncbi:MAG TPA: hypothetical protein PLW35_09990, partial [Verrucomicrobiota bacterium]|nr:hypothetical protein [Verrucomicrobiota bacterium]
TNRVTDTILWRPGWTGLGAHCGVMGEVTDGRGVPLAGVGAGGANRGTDTILRRTKSQRILYAPKLRDVSPEISPVTPSDSPMPLRR